MPKYELRSRKSSKVVVALSLEDEPLALFVLRDELQEGAAEAVQSSDSPRLGTIGHMERCFALKIEDRSLEMFGLP